MHELSAATRFKKKKKKNFKRKKTVLSKMEIVVKKKKTFTVQKQTRGYINVQTSRHIYASNVQKITLTGK